jgi:hypothetical membrane protein
MGKPEPNLSPGILPLVAVACVGYFGLVILVLSLFSTQFSPISQAASDYGIGSFALAMNAGFFVAGVGMIAFAVSLRRASRGFRVTPVLLTISGLVLMMDSYFHTNLEGTPANTAAMIHGFGGFFFFLTAPIGILLVSRRFGLARFLVTLAMLLVGFAILFANIGLFGLGERLVLLTIFSSVIIDCVSLSKVSDRRVPESAV